MPLTVVVVTPFTVYVNIVITVALNIPVAFSTTKEVVLLVGEISAVPTTHV